MPPHVYPLALPWTPLPSVAADALACLVQSKRDHDCPQVHNVTAYKSTQVEDQSSTTPQPPPPSYHAPMMLITKQVDRQLENNIRRQIFINELMPKIQRIRQYFLGNCLPVPTAEVIAAWNDLPNKMTEVLPMSMKTGLLCLPSPPPTPMELAFDAGDTKSPTPDEMSFQVVQDSAANEDNSTTECGYSNQPTNRQIREENSTWLNKSPPQSSDSDSPLSSSGSSPNIVGFQNTVNQWLLDYRARGTEPFIESLLAFGASSPEGARLVSRVAHVVIRRVSKISYIEGKSLDDALRCQALATFRKCWDSEYTHKEEEDAMPPAEHGLNVASLMGSLFDARVLSAVDIHLCLTFLLEGGKRFERLCAMHALLDQANDKLCKSRYLRPLMQFKDMITSRDMESGEYVWATIPRSRKVIIDILALIERWMISQAVKRDECQKPSNNRTFRNSAIGPRLRGYGNQEPFIVQQAV